MERLDADLEQKLIDLPAEVLDELERQHRRELQKREFKAPADYFPWHKIQTWILEAPAIVDRPVRVMLISGGNRGGKSAVMKGLWSRVIRRQSAINDQLRELDRVRKIPMPKDAESPIVTWVIPPTLEKARMDWIHPEDGYGLKYWAGDRFLHHREQPDNVIYTKVPGVNPIDDGKLDPLRCDRTLMKSQDQKLSSFEASAVDLALVDEELSSKQKWNSLLMRIGTTNGLLVMAYTPLQGLTWSYDRYFGPLVEGGRADLVGDRSWIYRPKSGGVTVMAQLGTADNPLAADYASEIEHDPGMTRAEKNARLYGEYGYVEGALIESLAGLSVLNPTQDHKTYVTDELPERLPMWFTVADPNKSFGATLAAMDEDGNLFFIAEHLKEKLPNRKHASYIKAMERQHIPPYLSPMRYADPGSAGAQATIDMSDVGLPFSTMPKGAGSVSASVKALRSLAAIDKSHHHPITGERGAPRVYFFRPGLCPTEQESKLAKQIGQARQDENPAAPPDTPHKSNRHRLDLFDCARYTASLARQFSAYVEEEGGAKRPGPSDRLPMDEDLYKRWNRDKHEEEADDYYLPEYSYN